MTGLYAVNIRDAAPFSELSHLTASVSSERAVRIGRYRRDSDKLRCLTAELLLRYVLAAQDPAAPCPPAFVYGLHGKPQLADSPVRFNLSHSGDWVICAAGMCEVGADVEQLRYSDIRMISGSFSPQEIAWLDAVPPQDLPDCFCRLWTLTESYVKYRGTGLSESFSGFTILPAADGSAHLTAPHDAVAFYSVKPDAAHWISLCIPADSARKPVTLQTVPFSELTADC